MSGWEPIGSNPVNSVAQARASLMRLRDKRGFYGQRWCHPSLPGAAEIDAGRSNLSTVVLHRRRGLGGLVESLALAQWAGAAFLLGLIETNPAADGVQIRVIPGISAMDQRWRIKELHFRTFTRLNQSSK